jgi:hypothetical protein
MVRGFVVDKTDRRGVLNVREKDGVDKRWWSPERDITVVFPALLRQTFMRLSNEWPEALKAVSEQLQIQSDDISQSAQIYGKLVDCVLRRGEDLRQALDSSDFFQHRVQALLGMIFFELITRQFCETYGSTLTKAEWDPNHAALSELRALLQNFEKSETK